MPLEGTRVVDLTADLGAMCGRVLADLGADVVLIEPPGGSPARGLPPLVGDVSLSFAFRHANKRGVVLDRSTEEGRAGLEGLLLAADVVVVSESSAVDPRELRDRHPHLVVVSVTGYGLTGPYAGFVYTDATVSATSGMVFKAGVADREPLLPPATVAYDVAGIHAAFAALTALWHRRETGWGQLLDVSANEAMAQNTDWSMTNASVQLNQGMIPGETRQGAGPVYTILKAGGGWVRLIILSPRQWHAMRAWLGEPDFLQDPELDGFVARLGLAHTVLNPLFESHFAEMGHEEAAAEAQRRGIVCTPVLRPDEVLVNEHMVSRGTFVDAEIAPGLRGPMATGFFEIDGRRAGFRHRAPGPGEHTAEVLADPGAARPAPTGDRPSPSLPLAGLKVMDFGHGGVGVEVGRMLVEYGADVTKIESRTYPDFMRTVAGSEMSPSFASSSRSKRSLGVNAKTAAGHDLLMTMAATADVVIENNSTGTMDDLGLGYRHLSGVNADVVMVSSQLLGSRGTWKDWLGYGPNTQPVSGMIHLWNYADSEAPAGNTSIFPDHFVGRLGAVAALANLLARDRRGRGAHVEVAQVEVPIGVLADLFLKEGIEAGSVRPIGNRNDRGAPWGMYRCAGGDEWVAITVRDDADWSRLVAALGDPTWALDEALAKVDGRRAHHDQIDVALGAWTSGLDKYEVQRILQDHGVPAGVMLTGSGQLADPHLAARGFHVEVVHQDLIGTDRVTFDGPAFASDAIAPVVIRQAPRLGEHSRDIAADLGLDADTIVRLLDDGVLEVTPRHQPPSA